MSEKWIVLVEAAREGASGEIERYEVATLLEALDAGLGGGALYSQDRYALQVPTTAPSPADALAGVLSRWADAVRRLGLPVWRVVRTEVLTPEELERDLVSHYQLALGTHRIGGGDPGHELLRSAFSDSLTGLLGREPFVHRVRSALHGTGAHGRVAVIYLDLDGFGSINDSLGSAVGDRVLLAVAQRLAGLLRPDDRLARLGGDGYAVLLEEATEDVALATAAGMLEAVRHPLTIAGHDLALSASAGVALSERAEEAQSLVDNAGAALAEAKEAGGARHVLFRPTVHRRAAARRFLSNELLQDRLAHLLLMQEVAVAANESETLEQAARLVMSQICTHVGCVVGHLCAWPTQTSRTPSHSLWYVADERIYEAFQEATDKLAAIERDGLCGRLSPDGRPVWIADLAEESDWPRGQEALAAGLRTAFAFPVLIGAEVVAILEFFSRSPMEPNGPFLDLLASVGVQLGRVVERERAVAALRRTAEDLAVSEAQLRGAQALARLGSWRYDLRTGETTWSDEMRSLYGLEPGAPTPDLESAIATVHPADRARAQGALSRLVESGERVREDLRIVRPDSEQRWHQAEGSVVRDEHGQVVAIYGTSQDITERKLVEEALHEREARLTEAERVARLGSWEWDLSTDAVKWSAGVYHLWGWDPEREITFQAFLATLDADDQQRLLAEATRQRQTGEPTGLDFRAWVADGEWRWFHSRARLVAVDNGVAAKVVGTVQDVTECRQAEDQARTAEQLYRRVIENAAEGS